MPKDALRVSHIGITLDDRSSKMEARLSVALSEVLAKILDTYDIAVEMRKTLPLSDIISHLNSTFGQETGVTFEKATDSPKSALRPDGGFLYVRDRKNERRCILVTEVKRQGTNADRLREGKAKQAQGNAIERLRKNMQGVDCLFAGEEVTPFVCFGEGCDFSPTTSTIPDRVSTMNGFFPLNVVHVRKIYIPGPPPEVFKPASLFFREDPWTPAEMSDILWQVCQHSISYYQERYGLLRRGDLDAVRI